MIGNLLLQISMNSYNNKIDKNWYISDIKVQPCPISHKRYTKAIIIYINILLYMIVKTILSPPKGVIQL